MWQMAQYIELESTNEQSRTCNVLLGLNIDPSLTNYAGRNMVANFHTFCCYVNCSAPGLYRL